MSRVVGNFAKTITASILVPPKNVMHTLPLAKEFTITQRVDKRQLHRGKISCICIHLEKKIS